MEPKNDIEPMTPLQVKALLEVERYWIKYGKWPKHLVATEEGFDLEEALKKESFIRGLFNRGISLPDAKSRDNLSQPQMAAILVVADINDRRSIPAKLKSMGISTQTWQGWMQDKKFKEFLHNLTSRTFEDSLHLAQQGLLNGIEKGDVAAIKYWHELTGRAVTPEVQNARLMIGRLVQVIQTHVSDEGTLMAIARDFERIMRGEDPAPVPIGIPSNL